MHTARNLFVGVAIGVVFVLGAIIWLCSGMNRRVEKVVTDLLDSMDTP